MSGIQILKLPFKYLQKNIRITVIDRAILIFTQLAEVSISYSGEVNHCRHLHPCRFRKLLHVTYPYLSVIKSFKSTCNISAICCKVSKFG